MVAAKSRWEEQGFNFDDSLPNYGLEQFIYNRLNELGWFRFARQPARANYNWVLEFCANNAAGEDFSIVRGKRVPATAATINALLGLSDDEPSFYAMLCGFEEEDFEMIKDFLCEENTAWNTTGRNPNSVSRPRINVGEILAKELATTCANDKGILVFPCLVSALCRRAAVPTSPGDNPISPAEPQRTPPPSPPVVPVSSQTTTSQASTSPATTPAAPEHSRDKTPDTPLGTKPSSSPSPPAPPQSEEAASPLHILQLRSQLQRIEARQLQFQEEIKVFNQNLLKFLCFQFPAAAPFFGQPSSPPPQPSVSAAAAAQPSTHTSTKVGATEVLHFSSDDENDIFDWQSPRDHLQPLDLTATPAPAVPILSAALTTSASPARESLTQRKGKAKAGRIIGSNIPSSPEEEAEQRPLKRRRKYHVITAESDEDDSTAEVPVARPEQSDDPSLYNTF
ncbi:hypothetical protein V6N13_040190 [Hibiscus sabdariffa]